MTVWRSICSLIVLFILTHALATSHSNENSHQQGRKLFGGYRIVPRVCRPSITLPKVSEEPAICMFNYECSQRNGQVVGACMDGFLFGACCQLPPKNSSDRVNITYDEDSGPETVLNIQELDHVPDVPILLNPDGTPILSAMSESSLKTSSPTSSTFDDQHNEGTAYTKISTFTPNRHTSAVTSPIPIHNSDKNQNAEKTQIPMQVNFSEVEDNYPILIGQPQIYDDLRLPSLLSHSDSHNDIQEQPETVAVNPIATILSPDQIFQIADPVDQLPALFSHGLGQSNYTVADTILLNENGTMLNETYNPDDLFKPSTVTMDMQRVTQTYSSASTDSRNKVTSSPIKPLSTTTKVSSSSTKIKSTTPKISSDRTKVTSMPIETTGTTKTNEKKKTTPTTTKSPGTSSSTNNWVKFTGQSSFSSSLSSSTTEMNRISTTNAQSTSKEPIITQMYDNNQEGTSMAQNLHSTSTTFGKMPTVEEKVSFYNIDSSAVGNEVVTTPMTSTYPDHEDELVRVPTINNDIKTGNKKDDVLDKEEIAINHIISILNNTTPGSEGPVTSQGPSSSIHTWITVDEHAKPVKSSTPKPVTTNKFNYTFYKPTRGSSSTLSSKTPSTTEKYTYTFYKPIKPSTYYNYEVASTETNYPYHSTSNTFPSRPSTYFIHGSSSPSPSTFSSSSLTPPSSLSSSSSSLSSSSSSSTSSTSPGSSSFGYSSRPTTNPPAPTVIVLGPLGTEFTSETTQKNRNPTPSTVPLSAKPTVSGSGGTKKPSVSTTITHNISTIISTAIKDSDQLYTKSPMVHTTISSWSNKPIFNLKPSSPNFNWPDGNQPSGDTISISQESNKPILFATTETDSYEDDTSVPNNIILDEVLMSFPPVRNPNLNTSVPVLPQEKPTIVETFNNTGYPEVEMISENEIPTPAFIEDNVLTNKVDEFVQKIVQSLQGNFQDLKDIVYNSNNGSAATPTPTRRPTAGSTTKKPVRKPSTARPATPTRKPTPPRRPVTNSQTSGPQKPVSATSRPTKPRPTSVKPKPSSVTTQKPQTPSKRPKPTRIRPTTSATTITTVVSVDQAVDTNTLPTTQDTITTSAIDYRTQCGVRPLMRNGRIVGGKAAQFGEWPWQVLVREATWLGLFTKNKCGGVLITDRYVITAAHCQPGFLASLVAVFGEYDISGELERKRSVSRNVRRVIVYKDYNPSTFENDLALLELESPIQFDEHIVPICMPKDGADFTGQMATVTGWGRLKYNGGVPSMLQEVKVPVMENSVCQEMFQTAGHSKLILDSFLCAGYANGQKDSCEGDSGGPLVIEGSDGRWTLVGTVSHGIKCAAPYLPGVYMRTTYFKPWLHAITGV